MAKVANWPMKLLVFNIYICVFWTLLLAGAQAPPPRLIVNPTSHLGFTVAGPSLAEVQACSYRAYLDGAPKPVVIPAVTCAVAPAPSDAFVCTTPVFTVAFPKLAAGFHSVQITHTPPPPHDLESPKSAAIAFTYQTIGITSVGVK
jgi:hypothetical protein